MADIHSRIDVAALISDNNVLGAIACKCVD